jgi:hypothetical protein
MGIAHPARFGYWWTALALVCACSAAGSGCTGEIKPTSKDAARDARDPSGSVTNRDDAVAGDHGSMHPAGSAGGGSANDPAAVSADACKDAQPDPGPAPLLRLSRAQYLNSARDLFGSVDGLEAALGSEADGYELGLVQADVAPVELESYSKAAETIAAAVTSDAKRLDALAPCAANADARTCARSFVQRVGARVYRASLAGDADVDRHMTLFDAGAMTSYAHGIELVLRGMLQAPRFLYRVEIGTGDQAGPRAVKLSAFELASRLSYTLWNTAPDAALQAAAESGELDTQSGIATELTAMLQDAKGAHAVRGFLERWLQLPRLDSAVKDEKLFPEWTSTDLRASMRGQAQAWLDDVLANQGGTLRALLTSTTVFVNKDLAAYYDAKGGDTFTPLQAKDGRAAGVLTLPAFLSLMAKPAESSPIYRGKFVREALLCHVLPPPPPNVPKPPDVTPGVSTRERLSQHETDPACSGCHTLMDPIGFGFERFDAVGRYRSTDGGEAIDDKGMLTETRDIDGAFSGVVGLGAKLAGSDQVRECMARQWFRYAFNRFERDADACSLAQLDGALQDSGGNLNELPRALIETDAFMYRHPLDYEESP